jgi:hypothetical protein
MVGPSCRERDRRIYSVKPPSRPLSARSSSQGGGSSAGGASGGGGGDGHGRRGAAGDGAAEQGFGAGQPAVRLVGGIRGRQGAAPALVLGQPQVEVEVGIGGIGEHQAQAHGGLRPRQPVDGSARLAAIGSAHDLAVDHQLGADELVHPIDQAPRAAVPGDGCPVRDEVEAHALAPAPGDQQGVRLGAQHLPQAAPDTAGLLHGPDDHASREGQAKARRGDQQQEASDLAHGSRLRRCASLG